MRCNPSPLPSQIHPRIHFEDALHHDPIPVDPVRSPSHPDGSQELPCFAIYGPVWVLRDRNPIYIRCNRPDMQDSIRKRWRCERPKRHDGECPWKLCVVGHLSLHRNCRRLCFSARCMKLREFYSLPSPSSVQLKSSHTQISGSLSHYSTDALRLLTKRTLADQARSHPRGNCPRGKFTAILGCREGRVHKVLQCLVRRRRETRWERALTLVVRIHDDWLARDYRWARSPIVVSTVNHAVLYVM